MHPTRSYILLSLHSAHTLSTIMRQASTAIVLEKLSKFSNDLVLCFFFSGNCSFIRKSPMIPSTTPYSLAHICTCNGHRVFMVKTTEHIFNN